MTTALDTYTGVESESKDAALTQLESLYADITGLRVAIGDLANAIRNGDRIDEPLQTLMDACADFTPECEEIEYLLLETED